jgi:hypothetical protein
MTPFWFVCLDPNGTCWRPLRARRAAWTIPAAPADLTGPIAREHLPIRLDR